LRELDRGIEPGSADDEADVPFQPDMHRAVQVRLASGARVRLQLQPDTLLEGEQIPLLYAVLRGRNLPGEDSGEALRRQPDPARRFQRAPLCAPGRTTGLRQPNGPLAQVRHRLGAGGEEV